MALLPLQREFHGSPSLPGRTLEDNLPVNLTIEAVGGQRYKTYRVLERSIV